MNGMLKSLALALVILITACSGGGSTPPNIPVTPPPDATLQSIVISNLASNYVQGTQGQLAIVGTFSDNSQLSLSEGITWSSSDNNIATVSSNGGINAVAPGTVDITATVSGISITNTIEIEAPSLQSIVITNVETNYVQGTQALLAIVGTFNNNSQLSITEGIEWASSDNSIATVSSNGAINAIAPGTVDITASVGDISVSNTITIDLPTLTSIQLSVEAASLAKGLNTQIVARGTFNNDVNQVLDNVVFSSSNNNIVSVGEAGVAEAVGVGSATITATLAGISESIELAVTAAELISYNILLDDTDIAEGTNTVASAIGTFTDSTSADIDVQWQISDTSIATISAQGVIEALSVGQVDISAIVEGLESPTVTLQVSDAVPVGLGQISNASIALGQTSQASATVLFSNDTSQPATNVQWVSSDTDIVSITVQNDVATLNANMTGSATITATASGFSTSFTTTVTPAVVESIAFSETSLTLPEGVSAPISVVATFSDASQSNVTASATLSLTPSTLANISPVENGEVIITAAQQGTGELSASFQGFTATSAITVNEAIVTGMVVNGEANVQFPLGTSSSLSVLIEYSDGSELPQNSGVSWVVSDESIGSINADGSSIAEVSGSQTGNFTVTASFQTFDAVFNVTVTDAEPVSLAITIPTEVYLDDTNKGVTAEFTYTDNTTGDATDMVTWSTNDSSIATISNTAPNEGLIAPNGEGNTLVTASYNGGELTASQNLQILPSLFETDFVLLDYASNPSVTIGTGDVQFTLTFAEVSGESIQLSVAGGNQIVALSGVDTFAQITEANTETYDVVPVVLTQNGSNSIAAIKTVNDEYAVVQIHEVRVDGQDVGGSQVAFSWAIRPDGQDNFSNYNVVNEIKLIVCVVSCSESELPRFVNSAIEDSETPKPTNFVLADFVLISIGRDYTVVNLQANDIFNFSTLSYDGLTNNQLIQQGYGVPFSLLATPTNGEIASLSYTFEIDGFSNLVFSFGGQFTSN